MKKEYEKLMQIMLDRKNELASYESEHSLEKMTESELAHGDALDIAEHNSEREMNMTMRLRFTQELQSIDDALEKMHRGVYGICENCEETIGSKRLKARPFVKLCIDCQEDIERSEEENHPSQSVKFDKID